MLISVPCLMTDTKSSEAQAHFIIGKLLWVSNGVAR